MARAPVRGRKTVGALTALAVAAPVLVLVSALGVRTGLWPVETGYDLLTMQVAWWLSFVSAGAGVLALLLSLRNFGRLGMLGLAAAIIGAGAVGGFVWQKARLAAGPVENVSTDMNEIPGFGEIRSDEGAGAAVGVDACPGARPVMTQVAPETAAWALQEAGFALRNTGVARADGSRDGFWYGFTHDAVIRIRPGRTDIRVAARDARPHGGEACRLVTRISAALTTGR